MKKLFLILLFIPLISFGQPCQVFGKVKFVEYGEDYKIKIVDFNEDCRVRLVNYNANKTGLWQIDEYDSRAIKIKVVEFGEDFRVKEVSGEFNLKRPSNLQAGKIDYGNSGNSGYNKYKDANRYQSGGATEQQMVGDAIDAAMEERRLLQQRAAQRRASQSNQYQGNYSYSSYRPPTEAERAQSLAETKASTERWLKSPEGRKKWRRWSEKGYKKNLVKYKKKYGKNHPDFEEFLSGLRKLGFDIQNDIVVDLGYPEDTSKSNNVQNVSDEEYESENNKSKAIELYNSAGQKYDNEDYLGAVAEYTKAIILDPSDADFYLMRGASNYNLNYINSAKDDYTKAIELNSDYATAYYNRGLVKMDLDDYYGAIADYTKALELDPNYADAFYNRGDSKYYLKDYYGSIADYTKALELDPNDADAFNSRGASKFELEDINGACADFRKAISLGDNTNVDWVKDNCN